MSEQWHSEAYKRILAQRALMQKRKRIAGGVVVCGLLAFATGVTIKNAVTPFPEVTTQDVTYNITHNDIYVLPGVHSGRGAYSVDIEECSSWKEAYFTAKDQMVQDGYPDWQVSYELLNIAMAEAESEDVETKALVMRTVINRVWSDKFPDTIKDVVFEKGQFTPVSNGRYYKVEPDDECWHALYMVTIQGWDQSQGALYFETPPADGSSTWHSRSLEKLFDHGALTFYTEKETDAT